MATPKGAVTFEAEGQTYTLLYSINALIEIEQALGRSVKDLGEVLKDPAGVTMETLRTIFRCGLTDHHPEIDDKAAGRLMPLAGATDLIGAALSAAFGTQEGAGPLANGATRGSKSTQRGSKSALPLMPSGA